MDKKVTVERLHLTLDKKVVRIHSSCHSANTIGYTGSNSETCHIFFCSVNRCMTLEWDTDESKPPCEQVPECVMQGSGGADSHWVNGGRCNGLGDCSGRCQVCVA